MNANIRTVGGAIGAAIVATVLGSHAGTSGVPSEHGWIVAFVVLSVAAAASAHRPAHPRKPGPAVGSGAGEATHSINHQSLLDIQENTDDRTTR